MSTKLRFAPSPTGLLHVGNARMAIINWLFAQKTGGTFILRLDDTDSERSKQEYADAIQEDLKWLGLNWDVIEHQSQRLGIYEAAFEKLFSAGRIYACYETAEELDYMRKRLRSRNMAPIYTRPDEKKLAEYVAEGRKPHWRFSLNEGSIDFDDLVRGPVHFETKNLSDPVIRREDGSWLYMLPSAIDDIDMGVTHVVRGEDHVANTALQVQMIESLIDASGSVPIFAHLPLLTDMDGGGLSKRSGSLSLKDLRADGIEPLALASYLAHMGTSDDIAIAADMNDLAKSLDFSHFGRGTPKFDFNKLLGLNSSQLHTMDYQQAQNRLSAVGIENASEDFWLAIRENIERTSDAKEWFAVCYGDITPAIEENDKEFLRTAGELLPTGDINSDTWGNWTSLIKEKTGRKGKELFMPLRIALTGVAHGPELKFLLPLMGREKALKRLSGDKG
ncbi:MAG: glutamate--tRNA ligase [Rhodospirillaceae bacterium]|nr:glutamate--tRNA ligase [Rhodospirillaceae bacterium]